VTGAPAFDDWFAREPSVTREAFCRKVGLPADRPLIVFAGSAPGRFGAEAEQRFVSRWLEALRSSSDEELREAGVLVRPHPAHLDPWVDSPLAGSGPVVVRPRQRPDPMAEADRTEYIDTLHHATALVGVSTFALVDAAVAGTPAFTVEAPEFRDMQEGRPHFRHLPRQNGGALHVARGLNEHLEQLGLALHDPAAEAEEINRFVAGFVRPHGLDRPCAPLVADAVESLGDGKSLWDRRYRRAPRSRLGRRPRRGAGSRRSQRAPRGERLPRLGKAVAGWGKVTSTRCERLASRLERARLPGTPVRSAGRSVAALTRAFHVRILERREERPD